MPTAPTKKTTTENIQRPPKKFKGVIVSNKMQKTVVVRVDRLTKHSKYKKYYKISKKFHVHNPQNLGAVGDTISFIETRPISKTKHWIVEKIIK